MFAYNIQKLEGEGEIVKKWFCCREYGDVNIMLWIVKISNIVQQTDYYLFLYKVHNSGYRNGTTKIKKKYDYACMMTWFHDSWWCISRQTYLSIPSVSYLFSFFLVDFLVLVTQWWCWWVGFRLVYLWLMVRLSL